MAVQAAMTKDREDLFSAIAKRLWQYEPVRSRDLPLELSLSGQGTVTVAGHAPSLTIKESILDIVGSIDGVGSVQDQIVADPVLEVEIAETLSDEPATSHLPPGAVQVFAQLGNIVLVGDLNENDREAVVKVAKGIKGVRQVVDRMDGGQQVIADQS